MFFRIALFGASAYVLYFVVCNLAFAGLLALVCYVLIGLCVMGLVYAAAGHDRFMDWMDSFNS